MNSSLVTTGPEQLTVGSTKLFQLSAFKAPGVLWDLTGGSAQVLLCDPNQQTYTLNATIQDKGAVRSWTVLDVEGTWVRAWKATDAQGNVEYSLPLTFEVIRSPGIPVSP